MSVLIVGSIALDTVKTPVEEHADQLGGSASYAALGRELFAPVNLVGVVGDDFPESEFEFWKSRKIDAAGVQRVDGQNISLVGRIRVGHEHARDSIGRAERFRKFPPELPADLSRDGFRPPGQHRAFAASRTSSIRCEQPRFVVADTMDLWIETTRADLDALLPRVDLLILNDSEARQMTKETSLIRAGRAHSADGSEIRRGQERRTRRAPFRRGRIFQLRRLSAGGHSRSDRGGGHVCRRGGGLSRGAADGEVDFAACVRR